jgi:hypothetical protein
MTNKTKKSNLDFGKIVVFLFLGLLTILGLIYVSLRLPIKEFQNESYKFSFKYPAIFEVHQHKGSDRSPYVYEINVKPKRLKIYNTYYFSRIHEYTSYINIHINDKNCDESLTFLIEHPLELFYKPTPTEEVINGTRIYELNNVADQYMYEFNKFACINREDKSIFIAGVFDLYRNGELVSNLKSKIIQHENNYLFKTIIKTATLK